MVFNRAHAGHIEMLAGSGETAKPSVIGDVHQHLGAIVGKVPYLVAEYRFVADEGAELVSADIKDLALGSTGKVANIARELVCEPEEILIWDILSPGHEVNLIVPRREVTLRRHQTGGVEHVVAVRLASGNETYISKNQIGVAIECKARHPIAKAGIVLLK